MCVFRCAVEGGDDGQKKVLEEKGRGWGGQITQANREQKTAWTKGTAQSAMTSSPGPVCNDSKEQQQRLMGESGLGGGEGRGEGRSRSQCGTSPLWG